MRVLKDFINGQIALDNDYTVNELLALMYFDYESTYLHELLDYENSPLESYHVNKIIEHIVPRNNELKFTVFSNVINSLDVTICKSIDGISNKCIQLLTKHGVDVDMLDISIHDFVIDEKNITRIIFNVNGEYLCQFHKMYYDDIANDVYTIMYNNAKIYLNCIYGVLYDDINSFNRRDPMFYTQIGKFSTIDEFYDSLNEIIIYEFNNEYEFEKASKLFTSNKELAKQVYDNKKVVGQL